MCGAAPGLRVASSQGMQFSKRLDVTAKLSTKFRSEMNMIEPGGKPGAKKVDKIAIVPF